MKNILIGLSLFIAVNSYGQKELIVSESKTTQLFYKDLDNKLQKLKLEDFRSGNGNSIRIWAQNQILTFGDNATLTLYASQGEKIISETYTLENNYNLDSLEHEISIPQIVESKDKRRKIDEFSITVEIRTSEEYQLVSTYGNKALQEFIAEFGKRHDLNKFHDRYINKLPRGNYRMGMSMISIDRLLGDSEEKSEFYEKILQVAENELQINEKTPVTEFPLVLINDKAANFKSINNLNIAKVEGYKILRGTATTTAIYGANGKNGVILVNTK